MTADKFNEKFSEGEAVRYYPVKGEFKYRACKTRSPAWELGHGAAVVAITGQSGSVSVDHITKVLP